MEEFLYRINSCEKIRPHLHNFPFEITNINLTIGFEDCQRKITSDGHVALMYIGRNQDLLYRGYYSDTEEFYSLNREPYTEARRIVEQKASGTHWMHFQSYPHFRADENNKMP